ncbi:hypothetical protein L4174_020465 [Photobacterium sp. CCB-ST2H9]|uniref:hypothetical protein n=1 Tax=Photobacterium sp. CCB-ST2H9 TaxID=2912855 RepID=UPI002003AF3E|nr:hypothetical protein [Photobacterium sp. CCB-ST2H9]UTM59089.1 hypothetical protein L4174_020465 [Photobacterium sp. CCB-ST2H9]
MKIIPIISLLTSVLFSQSVIARTDCPAAPIQNIQIEGSIVLYQQSGIWRRLGVLSDVGTKERYAALLSAQMAGKNVMIAYPADNYNCNATNYKDSAFIVRTYN